MSRQPDFFALLQALPDPCLVVTTDLRVQAVNDLFLTATGMQRDELLEVPLLEHAFPDPGGGEPAQGRQQFRASIGVARSTARASVAEVHRYDLPARAGRKSQRRYWSIITSPILAKDGTVTHLSMRVQDVTAARGMLAATVGRLGVDLDDGRPLTEPALHRFTDHLAAAGHRGADTAELVGQVEELLGVLQSRTVIEQAKGMLMATQRISADQAYVLLRQQSQHQNIKLRDVAAHHVAAFSVATQVPLIRRPGAPEQARPSAGRESSPE